VNAAPSPSRTPLLDAAERSGRLVPGAGARLWAEEIGPSGAVPVVLVHRMAAQCVEWPDELLEGLLAAGHRVVVFDNRGFGWSEPGPLDPPLTFQDLVDDLLGLLDALGITDAHLVGSSVGGVIARCAAQAWHGRTRSLTFIGSSTGDGSLPVWTPAYTEVAMNPPGPTVVERVAYLVNELRVMSDDRFDPVAAQARAERCVRRGYGLDALRRVARAARTRSMGDADLAALATITVPCAVVHGTDDVVLPLAHGEQLARAVPGASFTVIEHMNHDIQAHHAAAILGAMLPVLRRGDEATGRAASRPEEERT
jgi:pimeloyl-ACP methyl ester carboxylesterase